jgi:hypothetical protein
MSFSLRLGTKDDSQAGLRSFSSSVLGTVRSLSKPITIPLKIAGAGLGLLRDINLGLKPLVEGIDGIIERGTALDATRRSFISLVGGGAKSADQLAERLVAASHGTLRIGQAMELANRSIIAGIDAARDLPTILDFASKKAVTTGMDVASSLERIIMGLSRGSPAILDDFNLLVNGLDGVKESYDQVKGKGAWEQLGPAAQKAEVIRQALEDMQRQLGRIGIRGTETVFVWKQIKTEIGNATDKLMAAVGRSDTLRDALRGVRDTLSGITRHFETGGSLGELLFGKKDSKSGGLFGGLKAGLLDAGEALGRGIIGGILKAISAMPELFKAAWSSIKAGVTELWRELSPVDTEALKQNWDSFKLGLGNLWSGMKRTPGKLAGGVQIGAEAFKEDPAGAAKGAILGARLAGVSMLRGFQRAWALISGGEDPGVLDSREWLKQHRGGATTQPAGVGTGYGFGLGAIPSALTAAAMGQGGKSFFDWAGETGERFLSGGVLGGNWRSSEWWEQWQKEYPPGGGRYIPGVPPPEAKGMRLTAAGVGSRERNIRRLDREIKQEEALSHREARKAAGEQARELYRQGYEVTPEDRARLESEAYEKIVGFRAGQARKTRDVIGAELEARRKPTTMSPDELVGIGRNGSTQPASEKSGSKDPTSLLSDIKEGTNKQVTLLQAVVAAIGGVERAATG